MWHIPLVLRTIAPQSHRFVKASDSQIHYEGERFPWTISPESTDDQLPRATQSKGSWAELLFTGTGIEYVAEKSQGLGEVAIYVDGEHQDRTSPLLEDFPVFQGITIFSKQRLPYGKHSIKIVNASEARINVEGFLVYA